MKFSLAFDMDNAAFDGGDNNADEVCRILHTLADSIDASGTTDDSRGSGVWDVNGNRVGKWEVIDDE